LEDFLRLGGIFAGRGLHWGALPAESWIPALSILELHYCVHLNLSTQGPLPDELEADSGVRTEGNGTVKEGLKELSKAVPNLRDALTLFGLVAGRLPAAMK
jgi:hypothetical protein